MRLAMRIVLSILSAVDGHLDQIIMESYKLKGVDRHRDGLVRVQKKVLEARRELANIHDEMKDQAIGG